MRHLVLFDDCKLLLTEQFYLTDLSGVEDLFDHDVGVVAFRKEAELLCGCEGQEDGNLFLGLATEIRQTGCGSLYRRHMDRVIRAVRRDAGLTGLRPEGFPGFLELPPVVARARGAMGLAVGVHGLPASAVVVVAVTAVEADQGAGILTVRVLFLFLFVGRLGKDRRVDEVVVVVGDTEEEPETIRGLRTRKKGCLGGGGNK